MKVLVLAVTRTSGMVVNLALKSDDCRVQKVRRKVKVDALTERERGTMSRVPTH